MARSDHVTAFKTLLNNLRTDSSMTVEEKIALLALGRTAISNWIRAGNDYLESVSLQDLNTRLQTIADDFDSREEP